MLLNSCDAVRSRYIGTLDKPLTSDLVLMIVLNTDSLELFARRVVRRQRTDRKDEHVEDPLHLLDRRFECNADFRDMTEIGT